MFTQVILLSRMTTMTTKDETKALLARFERVNKSD